MKKLFVMILSITIALTLVGCNGNNDAYTIEISTTARAVNSMEIGAEVPDFTRWFKIEHSIDGRINVTEDMISSTLVSVDGKISEIGDYIVAATYFDGDTPYTSAVNVTVTETSPQTLWEVKHFMDKELKLSKIGGTNMEITYIFEDEAPIMVVDVIKAESEDWHTLFGYEGFEFSAGNTYTFTITAKTNVVGGRNIGVSFENSDHSRLNYKALDLTDEYQTFSGSFIPASDLTDAKLNIFLGDITNSELGEVIFKEIKVVESIEIIPGLDNPGETTWNAPDMTNIDAFVENLIATMSIEEKVGQMIQGERKNVSVQDIIDYNLGSVLNGGGSIPGDDIQDWYRMYVLYQLGSAQSSSGVPLIFGTDSVHGNNNLLNATVFPHNIGLGAANDPELMRRIGAVVAIETRLTGISWTFAPAVSIAQDARWGRTYESFSENSALVSGLTAAYIEGLQDNGVSASAKHYLGDGGTDSGKDQGNVTMTDQEIRELHLPPYYEAIEAGVDTIMISYSSIRNMKMHGSEFWIQDVLKDEMGFEGFIISDYDAIHQLPGSHYEQVVDSVNAGIDMLMEPGDWKNAYNDILSGYNNGDITLARINDAVDRILRVKYKRGLFTDEIFRYQPGLLADEAHLEVAREAVRKSLVLLQNNNNSLPLTKSEKIAIIGPGADDFGLQMGGWTLGWQGAVDPDASTSEGFGQYRKEARATTITDGFISALLGETGTLVSDVADADTVIVVLAETPYAEYFGDNSSLDIVNGSNSHDGNYLAIQQAISAKEQGKNVVGILLSGRPLLIEEILPHFDSFIAAWLPGSEAGNGIADVVFGDYNFTGKTAFVWYKESNQFGTNSNTIGYDPNDYLFPFGYGLYYPE